MKIVNKKARFNYFVEKELEVGIALVGTEVKSVKNGKCDIKDSYIRVKNNELLIINMFIAKYEEGNIFNHDEYRERKLLAHKKEIIKLNEESKINGYSLIPLEVYLKKGKVKILLGLCKGKKLYDKRNSIKERDLKKINKDY